MVEQFIQDMAHKVVQAYDPDRVLLFGSYARGQHTLYSDVDLLIVKDTRRASVLRGQSVRQLFYDSLIRVDLLVYTNEEFEDEMRHPDSFLASIAKTWIELYHRS